MKNFAQCWLTISKKKKKKKKIIIENSQTNEILRKKVQRDIEVTRKLALGFVIQSLLNTISSRK